MAGAHQTSSGNGILRQGFMPRPNAARRRTAKAALVISVKRDPRPGEPGRGIFGEGSAIFIHAMQSEHHGTRLGLWLPGMHRQPQPISHDQRIIPKRRPGDHRPHGCAGFGAAGKRKAGQQGMAAGDHRCVRHDA